MAQKKIERHSHSFDVNSRKIKLNDSTPPEKAIQVELVRIARAHQGAILKRNSKPGVRRYLPRVKKHMPANKLAKIGRLMAMLESTQAREEVESFVSSIGLSAYIPGIRKSKQVEHALKEYSNRNALKEHSNRKQNVPKANSEEHDGKWREYKKVSLNLEGLGKLDLMIEKAEEVSTKIDDILESLESSEGKSE